MAEGGQPLTDEVDSDQTEEFLMLPFRVPPLLAQLKMQGDERFRAHDYETAAHLYLMALNYPVPLFMAEVPAVSEQLFRRRAVCLYKMGRYCEAVEDSDRAITIAECIKSKHMVDSIFIKMKAIECLGDNVHAFKLAVLCKFLRPESEKIKTAANEVKKKLREECKKDDGLVDELQYEMLQRARELDNNPETVLLALECYNELLDLLDFMFCNIPGVFVRRAECLIKLGRYDKARDDCKKVLWMMPSHEKAIVLMQKISQSLVEAEMKGKPADMMQCTQEQEGNCVSAPIYGEGGFHTAPKKMEEGEPLQDQVRTTKKDEADAERERRKRRNKQKKLRKRKKKEAKVKKEITSEEQKTMSPERSADESENQETESVISNDTESIIEEKDLGCGTKAELKTFPLSSTCVTSDVSEYDEDGFVLVRRGRRSRGQGVKAATLEGDHQFKHPVPHAYNMTKKTPQSSTKTSGVAQVQQTFQLTKNNVRANRSQDRSSALTSRNISNSKELSQEASKANFVSTGLSYAASLKKLPPPAARGDSDTSSRRARAGKNLKEDSQAIPNDLKSYSASSHVQAGSTVSASQELESNAAPRVPLGDTSFQLREVGKIPQGIRVVCDHFLQVYPLLSPGTTTASPCEDCKSHNKLKYATWNSTRFYWQEIRPYPALKVPSKVTLEVCRTFGQNGTCPKLLCPFPHGKVELAMWTMERKGVLPTPQEFLAAPASSLSSSGGAVTSRDSASWKRLQSTSTAVLSTRRNSNNAFKATEMSIEDLTEPSSVLSSSVNRFANVESLKTVETNETMLQPAKPINSPVKIASETHSYSQSLIKSNPVNPTSSTTTTGSPELRSRVEEIGANSTGSLDTMSVKKTIPFPGNSMVINTSDGIAFAPPDPNITVPKTRTITESSGNIYRKIPDGVFVVCDDFLHKNFRRAASIHEKKKTCKGCEIRSKLRYAFWNYNRKQWEMIRPYPGDKVRQNVAFKSCRQFDNNAACLRKPCSFAHGEQELLMWILEREGVLPTPRETLTGKSEKTKGTSTYTQPQLRYRPCPPGVRGGAFKLCKSFNSNERCRYGRGCINAHGNEELIEWQQEYQRIETEKRRKELQDKDEFHYMKMTTKILKGPREELVESLPGVEVSCSPSDLSVKLQENNGKAACQWIINLTFQTSVMGYLQHVLLLYSHHSCYQLSEIRVGCYRENQGCESYNTCYTAKLRGCWYKAPDINSISGRMMVSLSISFESSMYGSFDQCVVFDFGKTSYLVQRLNADVQSASLSETSIVSQPAIASAIWVERSMEVVRFGHSTGEALRAEHLSRRYSLPEQVQITADHLRQDNYKTVMHQLLFEEEGFMKSEISSYTLNRTQLHVQGSIFDEMSGMKFAVEKEMFGVLYLQEEDALRPDDAAGRLLYRNVSSVWLQLAESVSNKVYEAPVEKVEKESVVLKLSSKMVADLRLNDTCNVFVNAQFQLNRWPLCELHAAIDRLTTGHLRLIFPEPRVPVVRNEVIIRWQWLLDKRLNDNQKEVVKHIASPEYNGPPLVVFGPFGTGKTFTLNQAVRLLVQLDKSNRILLCTHSNRAADIHVELLHDYLTRQNGTPAARPLRVYQPMRRLETTSSIARKYCLIRDHVFVLPSRDHLVEHRVVITTLSTSQVLLDLQVLHGFFTHILIDEAAQAIEPEALTPLIFAGPNTKVVFTGDHMQMSPEVYSPEARRLGLHKSLAERLFDTYYKHESQDVSEYYVSFLTENYRCHPDILKFPSDNFYGEKLLSRGGGSQLAHPKYGPLLFFSARGKERREHGNSYVNLSEVYEVVKRVKEVAQNWPAGVWGPKKLSDIAVLSAYRHQVQAIRNGLRKEGDLKAVKVDTIHNVQGEEFRALFISTVRTFHTCKNQQEEVRASGSDRPLYWEFLSDPKLLNTAVTRARCLVAVVGDPVSICTVGECRSIWRDYIKRCNEKGGLYGVTMEELDKEINAAIASIELNPKAEPFVPKSPSTAEQSVNTEIAETKKVENNKEISKQPQTEEIDQEVKAKGPDISAEDSQNVNDRCSGSNFLKDSSDSSQDKNKKDEVNEEEDEDDEERVVEPGDFQDDLLDDETVSPRDLDEIILAFVKKCEETLQLDVARRSMFQDSEFPPLDATGSNAISSQTNENRYRFSVKSKEDIKDLFPEIRVINGRVEVRLTNLGFYNSPSERVQRIIASTNEQDFLDPSVLRQLVSDEPDKYKVCNLRLNPEKFQVGYAEIEDTGTPNIEIRGRVRQAFERDKVVLELVENKSPSHGDRGEVQFQGKVVGVLEHIISPHERQFVCTADYVSTSLMVPINKSAPKIVNLSDRSCEDIPIYRKNKNNRPTQIRMMKRETALSGKYLFVVKYLQWRRECCHPLGIVVRTLPRGEDFKSSLEIAYAERGIRRVFREDTQKYVKENFSPQWSIPKNEYVSRKKIDKAFTIDPPSSLDLDDALTIEKTSPTTYLMGIHIADVSFFVKPDSPLDKEAFLRCTSYYPEEGEENIPMLPRELSEFHCSLLPDQDRLTVSLFITLDKDGRIVEEPKIQRTIVRSCCQLSYAEAQLIINERVIVSKQVPKEIVESVRQLSCVAQIRRHHRLGDRSFDHWQNEGSGEDFKAHELVEEMMILANEEVAKLISRKCSELALLRVQLPPKDHRLAEWIETHGRYAKLSLQFSGIFESLKSDEAPALALLHSQKTMFKIQKWVWAGICQAAKSDDLQTLCRLICEERNHPQIAVAQSQFRRIQSQSRYVCEGDPTSANIKHYSLGIRSYTHFTSPIRRYIDIAVHRLLLGLESPGCHKDNIAKDDMTKVCRRSTFLIDNARKFNKDCKRIRLATKLRRQCHVTRVFIESIEKQAINLHICNPEDDHLAGKQKRMLISHMNPVALTEEENGQDGEKCLVLTWKIRRYVAPDGARNVKEESNAALSSQNVVNETVEIPSDMWIQVLDAIRVNDTAKLPRIITQMETHLSIKSPSSTEMKRTQNKSLDLTRGELYRHPHYGEKAPPSSSEEAFHFYEKKLALKKYNFLSVQLCPHMTRGILQPDIQMVNVNRYLNICIEHLKHPRESFAHTARHQASREQYETIDEYINAWKPVLAMEAATEAVKENDGFVIEHLSVEWEKENESLTGFFTLTLDYCKNRQVEFYQGDLVCVRVPCPPKDCSPLEKQGQQQSCSSYSHQGSFWVSHCIIDEVIEVKKEKVEVTMKHHQAACNIPAEITHGGSHRCTLELIHRTLPQRRMYAALCVNLRDAPELVHAICKGEEPKRDKFGSLPPNLSLEQHGFKQLNQYQEAAVKEALSNPFSLIQGPPGTGKTVTGVHIAYWFAQRNQRLTYKVLKKDKRKKEGETAYRAPPQLIYCGPSNKAVDVVTEYLMKIPFLKILRVYSDQIEQKEFPIPNKLKPARITRSEDELKMSSERIRSVSLHHLIRSGVCPYAEELRTFEEGFAEDKARGEPISEEDVDKYCKLIGKAERWALEESGVQIILCTCATAGSPRIAKSCDNIQQCIVDECGMCLEPESLVPITSSGARQVVLIGDHKQLQPVIQDQVAKTLGLSVSMFERHSKRAMMLQVQYRMHKGICEFPSKEFYDDKLQTAEVVNSRPSSPVSFWPAQVRRRRDLPIVFCHVEGQEESSVITTSESNQESKRNMKEVRKVVQVAKYLVNRYNSVRKSDVVILSPYREQRSKISDLLRGAYDDIHVTTITKSQGSEWDYVIMSLVRSLKKEEIDPEPSLSWLGEHLGFLRDEHQMNVGLTRARRGLCIIGNKNLLGMDEMWSKLIEHYENNHCLVDESWPWT